MNKKTVSENNRSPSLAHPYGRSRDLSPIPVAWPSTQSAPQRPMGFDLNSGKPLMVELAKVLHVNAYKNS